jgi:hypothetical protein
VPWRVGRVVNIPRATWPFARTNGAAGTLARRRGVNLGSPGRSPALASSSIRLSITRDADAVRVWHEETWPAIRARAKAEKGEVLFGDQVGIRSDRVTGRTWGAKDTTPVVRRTGNRFSVNAMSAISTRGRMHFLVFTESFDAKVMCRFPARIVGHFNRKVHLIVDRHSAHRSKTVRVRLAGHQDQIEMRFLPSYSPELNPDGLVNADLQRSLPHTHRARNQAELAAKPADSSTGASVNTHCARLLRRPARPLRPGREPFESLINISCFSDRAQASEA